MFSRLLEYAERLFVGIANLALLTMMVIVTGSVIGRSAFNYPLPDDLLIVGLLMVVVIFRMVGCSESERERLKGCEVCRCVCMCVNVCHCQS